MPLITKNAFTLIEVLVVATIIGVLAGASFLSYRGILKSGRDSTRKAHLEQIRSAIEQYRSNNVNGSYPDGDDLIISCASTGGITDSTNTYLSKIPLDPSCDEYNYYYAPLASSGGICDSASSQTPCLDYTIAGYMEVADNTQDCTSASECGDGNCRYCLGPYGEK